MWGMRFSCRALRAIDLVLGGHTHTYMEHPAFLTNAEGAPVPVMHTGKNGAYVGELKLELERE